MAKAVKISPMNNIQSTEKKPLIATFSRVLSFLCSPFFVYIYALYLLMLFDDFDERSLLGFVVCLLQLVLIPSLIILCFFRKDKVTSFDFPRQPDRSKAYVLLFFCTLLTYFWNYLLGITNYDLLLGSSAVLFATLASITLFWRLSPHVSSVALTLAIVYTISPTTWLNLNLSILLLLLCYVRFHLKAHTLPQIIASVLLGFLSVAFALNF